MTCSTCGLEPCRCRGTEGARDQPVAAWCKQCEVWMPTSEFEAHMRDFHPLSQEKEKDRDHVVDFSEYTD